LFTGQAHPIAYTTIVILGTVTVLFGGFAREQVCIYMCPWPRIQAAMMDEDTITVAYREWRGEPRGKHNLRLEKDRQAAEAKIAAEAALGANAAKYAPTPYPARELQVGGSPERDAEEQKIGDCIDCMACVNVCPMGIDIRNGQQMECITCALCIDACDDVMAKIGKPRGLIDYLALTDETREREGKEPRPVWQHIFRLRTMIYTGLWAAVGVALLFLLFIRPEVDLTVAPIRNPQYVVLSDGAVRNAYDIRLRNKHGEDRPFRIHLTGDPALQVALEGSDQTTVDVGANEMRLQRIYISAPSGSAPAENERTDVRIWIEDMVSGERAFNNTVFNGVAE
ncbi:MAG: cytochrome c oxidase accessory protein CcoG, partial [Silicimonas sp.]|nr:cytochrome c oxidase accessory protein CcoG [Silicimonas sp.]